MASIRQHLPLSHTEPRMVCTAVRMRTALLFPVIGRTDRSCL